ncbi:MAG: hypothetical protein ABL995_08640 [Bryobacteraceae bacterium]
MAITIAKRSIQKISIIDDQAPVRESYELSVEDLGLESVSESGPLDEELPNCVKAVSQRADAAICDYNLKVKAYSSFNGAELAAEFYKMQFPAVLCTKWHTAVIDEMRQYLRFIPSLIDPSKLDPTTIKTGIESCIREFDGDYRPVRRPWRALVRVEDIRKTDQGSEYAYVVVPAWNSNEVVKLPANLIPPEILKKLSAGSRLHAKVNLGAAGNEELFFEAWEL